MLLMLLFLSRIISVFSSRLFGMLSLGVKMNRAELYVCSGSARDFFIELELVSSIGFELELGLSSVRELSSLFMS